MDLDPNFHSLFYKEKWDLLNGLFEKSDQTIIGIYNDPFIGVCLTNIILSMITSSPTLMKHVAEKQKCKPFDLCNYMKHMYDCLRTPVPGPMGKLNDTIGDVLRTSILTLAKNVPYASKFGLTGDYLLVKACANSKNLRMITYERFKPKCERLLKNAKVNDGRDRVRWDLILDDMFDVSPSTIRYHGQTFVYTFRPNIEMLNLEFAIYPFPKNQFYTPKPFIPNYEKYLFPATMKVLEGNLAKLAKRPTVVQMSVTESGVFEVHPKIIEDLGNAAINAFHASCCCWYNIRNFPVVLRRQHHTIPQLKNNEVLRVALPFGEEKVIYEVKAISIALDEEFVMMFDQLIPYKFMPHQKNPECVNAYLPQIMDFIMKQSTRVYNYLKKKKYFIREKLEVICEWVQSYALHRFQMQPKGIHVVALIQHHHQWLLMNDDYSVKVDDIGTFTELLKLEKFKGVLMEKE